jgi:hypothetical protein
VDKENMAYPHNEILCTIKRKEVLTHATTYVDLEDMLRI